MFIIPKHSKIASGAEGSNNLHLLPGSYSLCILIVVGRLSLPLQKHNEDLGIARNLISTPLPPLESALRRATGGGLERALLEAVVSKLVNSRADATR